jgi:hypothetical protein
MKDVVWHAGAGWEAAAQRGDALPLAHELDFRKLEFIARACVVR